MSIEELQNRKDDLKALLICLVLRHLRAEWPKAATILPSMFGKEFIEQDRIFIEVIQSLIDDGLILVEFFVIGAGEPIARETLLTRKGASLRFEDS